MSEKMRDIDALAGERWFPLETSIVDDMKNLWGDWGVCSEVDTLRDVIMRRPGKEIENFDWEAARFKAPIEDVYKRQPDGIVHRIFGAVAQLMESIDQSDSPVA